MSIVFTLATWRVRSTWFLLLVITLGMIVAVVIAWTIPLFSDVMETAGLRSSLRATPDNAEITLNIETQRLSSPIVQVVHSQFDALLHRSLGSSIHPEQSAILSQDFSLAPTIKNTILTIYGTSMPQATTHLGIIQGRLARITNAPATEIEVMMTPDTAKHLGMHVGSTFTLALSYLNATSQLQQAVTAHLVGLFAVTQTNSAYWHGNDFNPVSLVSEAKATLYKYTLFVADNALLAFSDHVSSTAHLDGVISPNTEGYILLWYYRLDSSLLTIHNLDSSIDRFARLRSTIDSLYGNLEYGPGQQYIIASFPYLTLVDITSPLLSTDNVPSILEQFRTRIAVARIPVGVFALLSIALILFFVNLMTIVLVDRQADTIALLRSRGASGGQIFSALFLQSVVLGIIALVLGLPLTALTVLFLAQHVLPTTESDAINIITSNPLPAMLGTIGYALAVVLFALGTMSVSLLVAARMNVLSLRREMGRGSRRPFWQRFNLDVIMGVVALTGYGFSLYVTSVGNVLSNDAQVLLATPLSIIAPFFLIVGCLLLFLRVFPLLLRIGARLAARGRGAISMLAFAQIARSPRQSVRLTMLLALAITFTLFTVVYNATENEHIQEIVAFETGADFSAGFATNANISSLLSVQRQYSSIPGVLSASAGRSDTGNGGAADLPMDIREVDAASFGQTVIWPSAQVYQQARPLLAKLLALRKTALGEDVVPAIVDATTLDKLLLHVGSTFTITLNSEASSAMYCVIMGVVSQIPTINDSFVTKNSGGFMASGGVLVDYPTYASIYLQDARQNQKVVDPSAPLLNQLWLRTKDDAVSLASIRAALNNPQYPLIAIVDRRLLLNTLQSDPLYLILIGVLGLGTVATLLLTLIGDLLVSWLSASSRLTSFALLRAMGITSRQVMNMLTWEQIIVYATGLLLGGGFGTILIVSVIPILTFTNSNSNLSNQQFFALQSALGTQLVVPPSLPLLLLLLLGIYAIALTIMVRVTTRSALSQALRLSED